MLLRVGRALLVVGCVSLGTAPLAVAADIRPVKNPPYSGPPAELFSSWAGFYLGGQVGYGTDSVRWRNLGASPLFSPPNSLVLDRGGGVIGGGQLGYNFQLNRMVFGIEGSMSAADFDRSFASPFFPATDTWSSKLTWLGTVTGRIGYGFDSWLPYIKGGFAAGNVDTSIRNNAIGAALQGSAVHYGWTVGGGVEFKVARHRPARAQPRATGSDCATTASWHASTTCSAGADHLAGVRGMSERGPDPLPKRRKAAGFRRY